MEWSKNKTMKLIELLQVNASLWNPSLCDSRRDKQKRREELRTISDILEVYVADITRKIQHLRTQYNRESAREARVNAENPNDRYDSSWYAFEYLHFLKDSSKPYRIIQSENLSEDTALVQSDSLSDTKHRNLSPPHKISRTDFSTAIKPDPYPVPPRIKDDLSVFGEYVANELRSLKGEKNLLIAKKKILDVIFEVKIGNACDSRPEPTVCTVFAQAPRLNTNSIPNEKVFTAPTISTAQIDPLTVTHTTSTSGISEIIINGACHYSNFKVDTQ